MKPKINDYVTSLKETDNNKRNQPVLPDNNHLWSQYLKEQYLIEQQEAEDMYYHGGGDSGDSTSGSENVPSAPEYQLKFHAWDSVTNTVGAVITQINEGQNFAIVGYYYNNPSAFSEPVSITGIDSGDVVLSELGGLPLTNVNYYGWNPGTGSSTNLLGAVADHLTEGVETLTITLGITNTTASIDIIDTSLSHPLVSSVDVSSLSLSANAWITEYEDYFTDSDDFFRNISLSSVNGDALPWQNGYLQIVDLGDTTAEDWLLLGMPSPSLITDPVQPAGQFPQVGQVLYYFGAPGSITGKTATVSKAVVYQGTTSTIDTVYLQSEGQNNKSLIIKGYLRHPQLERLHLH